MSFVIVASVIAVTTAVSAFGQIEAGKAQQDELERQAEEEKIAAGARELERKQQLNKILAANNASMAASGISMEGTPASIALESATQIGASEGMIALSDKLKQAQLRRQGNNARFSGRMNATSTLLQGVSSIVGGKASYEQSKLKGP